MSGILGAVIVVGGVGIIIAVILVFLISIRCRLRINGIYLKMLIIL